MLFVTVALDKQYILDCLVTSMFATYYGLSSLLFVFTSLPRRLRSIERSACLYVCLSVRSHIWKTTCPNLAKLWQWLGPPLTKVHMY